MYCRNCGQQLQETARFCRYCGCQVKTAQDAPTVQVPEQEYAPAPEFSQYTDQNDPYMPAAEDFSQYGPSWQQEYTDPWEPAEPAVPAPSQPAPRKAQGNKKLLILLAAAALLVMVLVIATVLIISSVTRADPEESSMLQEQSVEESVSAAPAAVPSALPTVTPTAQAEPAPSPTSAPQRLTLASAKEIVETTYGCYAVLDTQTEQEYTFHCFTGYDEAIGTYSGPTNVVVVDAYSGQAQITGPITGAVLEPPSSQAPAEPEPAVSEAPESTLSQLDEAYISDMVSSYVPDATWSWAVMDIETGDLAGDAMEESLSASALVNIPILYTVASRVDAGLMSLSDSVYISQSTSGRTQLASQVGGYLTVRELLTYMLQYSDNIASNSLMEHLGFPVINSTCAQAGYSSVNLNNYLLATEDYTANDNYVSCGDLCRMLSDLYGNKFSCLGKQFLQEYMVIQDSYAYQGLGAYVPGGVTFMNLNGQKSNKYNEVAIVDDGDSAYVVAFMGGMDDGTRLQYASQDFGYYIYNTLDVGT